MISFLRFGKHCTIRFRIALLSLHHKVSQNWTGTTHSRERKTFTNSGIKNGCPPGRLLQRPIFEDKKKNIRNGEGKNTKPTLSSCKRNTVSTLMSKDVPLHFPCSPRDLLFSTLFSPAAAAGASSPVPSGLESSVSTCHTECSAWCRPVHKRQQVVSEGMDGKQYCRKRERRKLLLTITNPL